MSIKNWLILTKITNLAIFFFINRLFVCPIVFDKTTFISLQLSRGGFSFIFMIIFFLLAWKCDKTSF